MYGLKVYILILLFKDKHEMRIMVLIKKVFYKTLSNFADYIFSEIVKTPILILLFLADMLKLKNCQV